MSKNNFDIINARITFKNVPLHKLERFSFKDVKAACESFKKIPGVTECVIVQNAFRVEVFVIMTSEKGDIPDRRRTEGKYLILNKLQETWISLTELKEHDIDHFDQTLEVYRNADVYPNLLRLATGLESLIVGRLEVLDEIKESIARAKEAKVSGNILNKLFDSSLQIATRIRDSTGIDKDVTSLADIAVNAAEEKAGLSAKKILLIGTGETAAMVSKALNKKGHKFDITSMTIERSTGFSKILGGTPITFEDVLSGFDKFDIIFVATTADYFLIDYDRIRRVMENKKKGTLILDISDPRAVHDKVSTLPGIKLMLIDQFAELDAENVKTRNAKAPAVEEMISKEIPILEASMEQLEAEPITN